MKQELRIITISLLALISTSLSGQQVISTAGGSGSGTGIQISWTIGEPVIETFTGTSNILTQGFHQTRLVVTAIDPLVYPDLLLSVYPNPVSSTLKLEIQGEKIINISYRLFNLDGKQILTKQVENLPEMINMEIYAPGAYLLKVYQGADLSLKTFKIIKN